VRLRIEVSGERVAAGDPTGNEEYRCEDQRDDHRNPAPHRRVNVGLIVSVSV